MTVKRFDELGNPIVDELISIENQLSDTTGTIINPAKEDGNLSLIKTNTDLITTQLDMKLSELASSLENVTVEISSVIGIQNSANVQINPATEETLNNAVLELTEIKNKISTELTLADVKTLVSDAKTILLDIKTNTVGLALNETVTDIIDYINEVETLLISISNILSNIKSNTDKLDINLSSIKTVLDNQLDIKLSELANALEEITVEVAPLIGLKNSDDDQINPATDDSLQTINTTITGISSLIDGIETLLFDIKNVLDNVKTDTSKLDVSLSTRASESTLSNIYNQLNITLSSLRDSITGVSPNNKTLKDIDDILNLIKTKTDNLDTTLSSRSSETTLSTLNNKFISGTVIGDVNAAQKGTWSINNISGTVSLPTNAAQETDGNLASIKSNTDKLDVNLSTRASETTLTAVNTKLGEIQDIPSQYTLLRRLKDLWDALYDIFSGNRLLGWIKNRPDYSIYSTGVSGYDILEVSSGNLATNASQIFDFVVPNGEKWHLVEASFGRQYSTNTKRINAMYQIRWDPTGTNKLIAQNYLNSSVVEHLYYAVTGNGTRVLRIIVTNASEDASIISGTINIYREVI